MKAIRQRFLETADVARLAGVTPATIREAARAGILKVAALTSRGSRLFRTEDAEDYSRQHGRSPARDGMARATSSRNVRSRQ